MRRCSSCRNSILVSGLLASLCFGQAWKDRGEYDLALAVRTQADAAGKLAAISAWKQKYPQSEFQTWRLELEVNAAREASDWKRMRAAASELTQADGSNLTGLYWTTLLAPSSDVSRESLPVVSKAARGLLAMASSRPPALSEDSWKQQQPHLTATARKTLGWIEWQNNAWAPAETELRAALEADPNDAEASSWLGTVLALQKTPEKHLEALWHLSRAVYTDGERALPAARRRDARTLLQAVYVAYHGRDEGLDALGQSALRSTSPPPDFRIETAAEVAQRLQDDELARTNPDLAAWVKMKRRLSSSDGQVYVESLTGTPVMLKGVVVRATPPRRPTELGIAITDSTVEEVALKITAPLTVPGVESGVRVEFEATPTSLKSEPFLLQMSTSKDKVVIAPKPTPQP